MSQRDINPDVSLRVGTLNHFTLPVRDRYHAARFYVAVLGGEVDHESDPDRVKKGLATALQVGIKLCPGIVIDLFEQTYGQPKNEQLHPHFAFDVSPEELDRWIEHLEKWQVPHVGPMTRAGTGAGEIYLDDPDGNHLELYAKNYPGHARLPSGPYDPRLTLHREPWPPAAFEKEADQLLQQSLERMRGQKRNRG